MSMETADYLDLVRQAEERLTRSSADVCDATAAPRRFRVNGGVRNIDAWYPAFDVKPGDQLYLPSDKRVAIW
jgi:predicted metalloendopeptidase